MVFIPVSIFWLALFNGLSLTVTKPRCEFLVRYPLYIPSLIFGLFFTAQTVRLTAMYEDGTVLYSTPVFCISEDYFVEFHTVFE